MIAIAVALGGFAIVASIVRDDSKDPRILTLQPAPGTVRLSDEEGMITLKSIDWEGLQ